MDIQGRPQYFNLLDDKPQETIWTHFLPKKCHKSHILTQLPHVFFQYKIQTIGAFRFGLARGVKRGHGGLGAGGKVDQFVCNTSR